MDKQNLMPQPAQPVNRTTTGQLPPELAELSEEALQDGIDCVVPSAYGACSVKHRAFFYDGDDAE